ncbi:hypothetical protein N9K77_00580 [bacterium]|nr:hypothetical protein [bacterium]
MHKDDLDAAIETYNYMSEGWFTHATPTLFNSGKFFLSMDNNIFLPYKQIQDLDHAQ